MRGSSLLVSGTMVQRFSSAATISTPFWTMNSLQLYGVHEHV